MEMGKERKDLSEMGVADSGKVLVMFHAASKGGMDLEEEFVDSYVYLLDREQILKFVYPFHFTPLPYSPLLRTDLKALVQGEYLSKGSRIYISPFGIKWVEQEISDITNAEDILMTISRRLKVFTAWNWSQVFQAVYAKLVR